MKRLLLALAFFFAWIFAWIPGSAAAVDLNILRCTVEEHPQWPSVSVADLMTWGNTDSISYRSDSEPSRDLWTVIASYDEYEQLSDGQRDVIRTTLFGGGNAEVDISANDTPEAAMLIRIFGAGTDTRAALLAAFTRYRSPFDEAGVSEATQTDVEFVVNERTCEQ